MQKVLQGHTYWKNNVINEDIEVTYHVNFVIFISVKYTVNRSINILMISQ